VRKRVAKPPQPVGKAVSDLKYGAPALGARGHLFPQSTAQLYYTRCSWQLLYCNSYTIRESQLPQQQNSVLMK